jgi:hypothetical protein
MKFYHRLSEGAWPHGNDPHPAGFHPNESPHPNRHPEGARPIAMGEGLATLR